ncbi:MAG TPA: FAD-dependent oxidoreductase [Candidatus Acidoferrum sp.]|nr:FAD-dependent oxidoreductase [Candidatus Acidoferrum sp.]
MSPSSVPGQKAKYAWSDIDRAEPPKRAAADRVSDFQQTHLPYDEATAREQASRCIQCPNPRCVEACPLGTPIHELLAMIADGQFKEAAELLFVTHSIPELASHVCVGGRVCEQACILAAKSDPVPVRALTRFLLDYGWKHGLAEPAVEPAKGQTVAVIGSGIGGLVTADTLSRNGYAVTVFDSRLKPGGRVMNGMPGFRVDKDLVERRLELLRQRGIHFRMGVNFGQEVKLSDLRREFDAVFLGFGLADAMPLKVPGADLKGVYQAFPFIIQNAQPACGPKSGAKAGQPSVDVRGRRVVVLGGGDTAMDVLRIAIRRGAASALCLYRRDEASLPADAEEYADACEEGAKFLFLAQPVAVLGDKKGEVTAVRCVRMEAGKPDDNGRARVKAVHKSEFEVPADVVFVAYGFDAPRLPQTDDFAKLSVDGRGCLVVDANQMTNFPGVFASGSIVRGPMPLTDVVRGARQTAAAMDAWLAARR